MKKLAAIAVLSIVGLGMGQGKASAWWEHLCCHHKCCLTLCCRQYNAFSPFCCDGACGFMPLSQGCAYNGGCAYAGEGCCLGELPAPGGATAGKGIVTLPPSYAPMPNGPADTAPQLVTPGAPTQGFPAQGYPVQNYPVQNYQGYQGVPTYGYGQGYPTGVPSYNPNFAGYGTWNGGRR